jgi:hypothetical protein
MFHYNLSQKVMFRQCPKSISFVQLLVSFSESRSSILSYRNVEAKKPRIISED